MARPNLRWIRHTAFLAPAALLMLYSGWQLVREFSIDLQGIRPDGPPIGKTEEPQGDVKRRAQSRFRWLDLGDQSPVYSNDSVRTTTGGATKISLDQSGGQVELGENALLVLTQSADGKTIVNLASGTANFKSGKGPILIRAQGQTFEASDAQGRLSIDGSNASIQLSKGKIIGTAGSNPIRASGQKQIQIGPGGVARVGAAPPLPLEPAAGAQFVGGGPVTFKWAGKATTLELYRTETGALRLAKSQPVSGATATLTLDTGIYEWRVVGESPDGKIPSPSQRMTISPKELLKLVTPENGSKPKLTTEGIFFAWVSPPYNDKHTLRVAKDRDFTIAVQELKLGRESAVVAPGLAPGNYFWRVEGRSTEAHSLTQSEIRTFEAVAETAQEKPKPVAPPPAAPTPPVAKAAAPPPAPVPVVAAKVETPVTPPVPGAKLEWKGPAAAAVVSVAKGAPTPKVNLTLGFPSTTAVPQYKLVLKRGDETVLDEKLSAPKQLELEKPGKYKWVATTPSGAALPIPGGASGEFEIADSFEGIKLLPPDGDALSNRLTGNDLKKDLKLRLRWQAYPNIKTYTIRIATDAQFQSVFITKSVEATEFVLSQSMLGGRVKFFYDVQARLPSGFTVQSNQVPLIFNFLPPKPVAPMDRVNISLNGGDSARIIMTWEKTNFTDGYAIEVAKDPSFARTIVKKEQSENFLIIDTKKEHIAPGAYYWRVKSFSKPVYSEPSTVRSFTVTQ